MFQKFKQGVLTILYLVLLGRFLFWMGDPTAIALPADTPGSLPLYAGWRPFIDNLYLVAGVLNWPVSFLVSIVNQLIPATQTNWFPVIEAQVLGGQLQHFIVSGGLPWPEPIVQWFNATDFSSLLPGYCEWVNFLTMAALAIISPIFDRVFEFLKNFIWNLLIEFSFTKKKQKVYQQALEKRASDLMQLNVEYRNLAQQTSKLKDSVITDDLTKVFNKRFFIEKIREEFEKARETKAVLTVIMMDIDHFKKLNDTYGHLMGDKVLQRVAAVAKQATPSNCFCCRFGGEEFSVILPAKDLQSALQVAEYIKTEVASLTFDDDPKLRVTISQGISTVDFKSPLAGKLAKFDAMVKMADDELYRAKLEGRNRYCYTQIE
ncbi:MAG: GGDEF domain-containing protein [Vampirovibrio sp.]|nr:GGDEF domain-containing protein [Vampirovibrio sp.]